MNIQVLKGLNLQNDHTVIKITLSTKPKTELLELIKSYHEVYLRDYEIVENTIIIHSDLDHMWKLIAPVLEKYSTNEWSYDLSKEYIRNEVIKNHVPSMSSIPIFDYAQREGIEITQYFVEEGFSTKQELNSFNKYYILGCGVETESFSGISSSHDSYIGFKTQRDKWATNTIVQRLRLPIAKWDLIESEEHLKELFNSYNKPVVIKPTGLTQGNGVVTKIDTLEKAIEGYRYAMSCINEKPRQKYQYKVMIQEQVQGDDYRFLTIDGKMFIATKRVPAFITGDGKSTIKELIDETNRDPRRDINNPAHILKPIQYDEMLDKYLSEQNLTLEYIPKDQERVYVRKVASMSQGGITEDVTDNVHPQLKSIVESISSTNKSYVMGIDVICKDISQPLTKDNGSIIEINTMNEAYLNAFPVIGRQYPEIGEIFVQKLLSKNPKCSKYVTVGLTHENIKSTILTNIDTNKNIGIYINKKIYINNYEISQEEDIWRAIEALKLNKSLDIIIINHETEDSVREYGLGFSRIDEIVLNKNTTSSETISKLLGYRNLGLINKVSQI